MTRILLVSGSQRRESLNTRLLRHLARCLENHCTLDVLEANDVALPLFNQDIENTPPVREQVATIHARFLNCHGLLVASPEYNGQLTPYLKNLIDWVSRLPHIDNRFNNPFVDLPVLLCSASRGWSGGAVGIAHARALFGYVGCVVIGDVITVPYAERAWLGNQYFFAPPMQAQFSETCERLVYLAQVRAGRTRRAEDGNES